MPTTPSEGSFDLCMVKSIGIVHVIACNGYAASMLGLVLELGYFSHQDKKQKQYAYSN